MRRNRILKLLAAAAFVAALAPAPAPAAAQTSAQTPMQPALPAASDMQTTPDVPALKRRDEQIMTLQTTTRLVVLDVVVTDAKGVSVKGLLASDFHLTEDGVPQTLTSCIEHTRTTPDQAAAEAARMALPPNTFSNYAKDDGGMIVFLIDALDNQVTDQMRLRQYMIQYLKTKPAGARVAIFQLDTQMHLVQGFTSDPDLLLKAVESKRDAPGFSPVLGNTAPSSVPGDPLARYERGSAESQNNLKIRRGQILTDGMQTIGRYLAGFPGRKSLVWFTGDIPVWRPGNTVGSPGAGFSSQFGDQTSFIDDLNKTTDVLRLNQVAIYPVDIRGLTAAGGVGQILQHGALADVAAATGGKAFYNTNGITQAMAEVADETTNYYTLSYTPTNTQFDGSYRKLAVTLTPEMTLPGEQLAYRPGYVARSDDYEFAQHRAQRKSARGPLTVSAVGAPPPTAIDAAMPLGAPGKRDVLFFAQVSAAQQTQRATPTAWPKENFLAASYRKGAYRNYVVHFAVKGSSLDLTPAADGSYHGKMEFVAMVYDDKGNQVNSKVTRTSVNADARAYPAMLKQGVELAQTIAVPAKGNFFLRLGVHDVTSDKAGTLEIPIDEIKLGTQVASAAPLAQPHP